MAETVQAWKCDSCDELFPLDEDLEPCYECGNCGEIFTRSNSADGCSHKCPQCGKFASKLFDNTCPNCQDTEVFEVEAQENEDGELVEIEAETPTEPEPAPDGTPAPHVYKSDCPSCHGTGQVWLPHILEKDPEPGYYAECICWMKRDRRGRLINPHDLDAYEGQRK